MRKSENMIDAQPLKSILDLMVLKFLNDQPMYGYQINKKLHKDHAASTIYEVLQRLERKRLVTSEYDMTTPRLRRVYRLRTEGQELLHFTEALLRNGELISASATTQKK